MTSYQATFTRLQDSTREDWAQLMRHEIAFARALPQRVLAHLRLLDVDAGGFPVNRLQHSLQAATRAMKDGRDDEYVLCALLHDIGDTLGSYNHPDIAVAVLKPFVSDVNLWIVQHHGTLQGYHFFHHIGLDRHQRDALSGSPYYEQTLEFVELYDNTSFDPAAETLPLEAFEPLVHRLMAAPRQSVYLQAIERL